MKKALTVALMAIAPLTQAGDLNIPQEFEFIAINGQSISSSLFSHNDSEPLKDGENKVALIYKDLVAEDIGDGHIKVKSVPFVISFNADSNLDYQLQATVEVDDESSAKAFAKNPQIKLVDSNGYNVNFNMALSQQQERGLFNQIMGQYPDAEAESIAATGGPAVQKPVAKADPVVASTATAAAAAAVAPPAPMQANQPQSMLHYWWGEADKATQSGFAAWAVQQIGNDQATVSNGSNQAQNMLQYWFTKADEATQKAFMSWAIQNM